jgi:hypothetical protein
LPSDRADAAAESTSVEPPDGDDGGRFSRRRFLTGAATTAGALMLGGLPAFGSTVPKTAGPAAACDLPHAVLQRIWRGYRKDRSGQLIVVPHGANYMAGGISHSTPFPYTQDVPMFWYGPGFINPSGHQARPVTSADVAPTIAELIGFDWNPGNAVDGTPMVEAIAGTSKPKLVVVVILDAGGSFVLDLWPNAWPYLKGLIPHGTWFDAATVGSNPSNTAPIHATIGTGTFPMHHGIVDNTIRFPNGELHDPFADGPNFALRTRAVAEDYQNTVGDDAIVGLSGTVPWHLGVLGRGSDGGGRQTMAVLKEALGDSGTTPPRWGLPPSVAPFYRCPEWVNDTDQVPPIQTFWNVAEKLGGGTVGSGTWRGHDIASLQGGFHSPARIPFQHALVESLIKNEQFGRHAEPDLLFLNFKLIDEVGHMFYASSIEMKDAISVQDRYLKKLVTFLNSDHGPGRGEWAMLLTADHGHTAAPSYNGSFAIDERKIGALVNKQFDHTADQQGLIDLIRPIWLNMDRGQMDANDVTIEQVAKFMAGLTKGQTPKPGVTLNPIQARQRVFDAVFASSLLTRLPCLPEAHE